MTPTRNLNSELTEIEISENGSIDKLHYRETDGNFIDQHKIDSINNPLEDLLRENTTTETIITNEGETIDTSNIEVPLNFNPQVQANSTEIKIGLNQLEDSTHVEIPTDYDG